ncbi:hypothetical protein CEP71_021495 [Escherichia coli O157]|nr:hypothetical protein CEP71_021495 [Escherichia coli O157]
MMMQHGLSLIQLKLQAGRKLTQAETTRLNAVLDYIDAVPAAHAALVCSGCTHSTTIYRRRT